MVNEPIGVLDYRIPAALTDDVRVGSPVCVPLGKRKTRGYVVGFSTDELSSEINLRDINSLDTEMPELPSDLVELLVFAARYYHCPPSELFHAALPAPARSQAKRYAIADAGKLALETEILGDLDRSLLELATSFAQGFTSVACERHLGWSRRRTQNRLRRGVEHGWLNHLRQRRGRSRRLVAYRRNSGASLEQLSPALHALAADLSTEQAVAATELAQKYRGAYAKLKRLEASGIVSREMIEQRVTPSYNASPDTVPDSLTPEQQEAVHTIRAAMEAGKAQTILVQGVTGSGKTEVYLRAIELALTMDKTALILVPEIALTPQLGQRFRSRFGESVATFHSGLTAAEKRDEWDRVARGKARIGLGARSALFLPLRDLGIVVVDEEHESSFKQDETPRYHARDLAVVRARLAGAVAVLGSATPAIESFHNVSLQRYRRLLMPYRISARPLPDVHRINLREETLCDDSIFTSALAEALELRVRRSEQIVLFLNRRGYAASVSCRDCGYAFRCSNCDVSLTLHRGRDVMVCHHCGYEERVAEHCPSCHGLALEPSGLGTERVQIALRQLLPGVTSVRLDRDTVRKRSDLQRVLGCFASGEAQVLIGTQMVAKGHDFSRVTLVGVLNADAGLNFPDFRAAERTFQLLTQVAGRAGRGDLPGEVIVQSHQPDHYAIAYSARHDYEGFVAEELRWRQELDYPPYAFLAMLRFESHDEHRALRSAERAAENLRRSPHGVTVLGPAPSPLSRLRGRYRVQVLLKARDRRDLHERLRTMNHVGDIDTREVLDVDPISML